MKAEMQRLRLQLKQTIKQRYGSTNKTLAEKEEAIDYL